MNQNLAKPGNFNSCFYVVFDRFCQSFVFGGATGHWGALPKFEISQCKVSFWYQWVIHSMQYR